MKLYFLAGALSCLLIALIGTLFILYAFGFIPESNTPGEPGAFGIALACIVLLAFASAITDR